MKFESFIEEPAREPETPEQPKHPEQHEPPETPKKLSRLSRLTSLMGGVLAATSLASAADTKLEHSSTVGALKPIGHTEMASTNNVAEHISTHDTIYEDGTSRWDVDLVSKPNSRHLTIRYIKTDTKTNETHIIGEYDNVIQAAQELEKMENVPVSVKRLAAHEAGILKTEEDFKKSGFVGTQNKFDDWGHTVKPNEHLETRGFKGYGINTENEVYVDDKDNVTNLKSSVEKGTGKRFK